MATMAEVLEQFDELPANEQLKAAAAIQRQLTAPTAGANDKLWYIVVGSFAALMVLGFFFVGTMIYFGKPVDVLAPFVTLAAGVLGGLLAPSPVKGG